MSTPKTVSGKVLQRLRSGRGLVQEELASRLGKARSSLAGWEAGRGGLNLDNLVAYLDAIGVTMEEFGRQFDHLRNETAAGRGDRAPEEARVAVSPEAEPGSMVLQAEQALVMVFTEQAEPRVTGLDPEKLRPWMRELFQRVDRMYPGPEEMPEVEGPGDDDRESVDFGEGG